MIRLPPWSACPAFQVRLGAVLTHDLPELDALQVRMNQGQEERQQQGRQGRQRMRVDV